MNVAEIERIGNEAAAEEVPELQSEPAATSPGVVEEFADFLDMAANVAGTGFALPTVPQRFNHAANVNISAAAVKLCERYGLDARSILIGGDSVVAIWLGLLVSIGLPAYGCMQDWKLKQASEVREEGATDGVSQ